jgi:alpha-L-rhamnosidase
MRSAEVLGKHDDARFYDALLTDIRRAFLSKFVSSSGRIYGGTQTAYALALEFDLLPEKLRLQAARYLAEDVRARGHLTTGLLGTKYVLKALTRFGYLTESYQLLNRTEFPSWLYPLTQGATTFWERWDGIKPNGEISPSSFNHYMFAAVGDWMYKAMSGITVDPMRPGYQHSFIRPLPGGGFTHVRADLKTVYGMLSSRWQLLRGQLVLEIEVPPNTEATVNLPNAQLDRVRESGNLLSTVRDIENPREEQGGVSLNVGSGHYRFSYPWKEKIFR